MAKRSKKPLNLLPLETEIEIVVKKGNAIRKVPMKFGEWLEFNKSKKQKPGWKYSAYQQGFCTIKESK